METPKTLTERVEKGSKTMTFEEYTRMMYYGNPQDAEREAALRREYETARRVMELVGDGMDAEMFCSHFAAIGGTRFSRSCSSGPTGSTSTHGGRDCA